MCCSSRFSKNARGGAVMMSKDTRYKLESKVIDLQFIQFFLTRLKTGAKTPPT
jgi:intein-encoded DNA endonuclease-like protein